MAATAGFKKLWHFLENLHLIAWVATGLYTITTFGVFISFRDSLVSFPWYGWFYVGTSIATIVLLLTLLSKRIKRVRIDRETMISTGNRLIRGVKSELVMFGGDMSWAPNYRDSLFDIVQKGKTVTIIFPKCDAERVKLNAEMLNSVGANMWPLSVDLGLRAMLIDPSHGDDALVYLVDRSLKKKGIEVTNGEPGTGNDYEYLAQVFDTRKNRLLLHTISRLYKAASLIVEKP